MDDQTTKLTNQQEFTNVLIIIIMAIESNILT